jgi:hypothetical protein
MDTAQRNQPVRKLYPPRSFLYLIAEETRQRAIEVRQVAREAKQTAQEMRHLAWRMRQRNRERRVVIHAERS